MPGEKMFEAQVGHKVPCTRGKSTIIFQPVAGQHQRLRLVLPAQALDVESPEIPFPAHDVRRVRVQVLHRHRRNFGGACMDRPQIPLRDGRFSDIHSLHNKFGECILRGRERGGRQKPRKLSKHGLYRKVARPYAQVGVVGHLSLVPLRLYRDGKEVANPGRPNFPNCPCSRFLRASAIPAGESLKLSLSTARAMLLRYRQIPGRRPREVFLRRSPQFPKSGRAIGGPGRLRSPAATGSRHFRACSCIVPQPARPCGCECAPFPSDARPSWTSRKPAAAQILPLLFSAHPPHLPRVRRPSPPGTAEGIPAARWSLAAQALLAPRSSPTAPLPLTSAAPHRSRPAPDAPCAGPHL